MTKIWKWIKKEFHEILPVLVFFLCAFALLSFTFSALLRSYHVRLAQPHEYLIAAIIMAKTVPTVDALLRVGRFTGKPLIYPTLWNTLLYFMAALIFHHVEHVFTMVHREHFSLVPSIRETLRTMTEPRYWAVMVWLFAVIFAFCAFRELSRSMGSGRLKAMFFGSPFRRGQSSTGAPPAAA
jgi:hypothetical protein